MQIKPETLMEKWTREEIKKDPVLFELLQHILKIHQVPDHTAKHLLSIQHIENICELTTLYLVLPGKVKGKDIYLSYETSTWIKPDKDKGFSFPTRVDAITMFEDFIEYETNRVKNISKAPPEGRDASTLNLN